MSALQLSGDYLGSERVADTAVSLSTGKVAIVVEVAVEQDPASIATRVEEWLTGLRVQLVIVVNIEITKADIPAYSSFPSNHPSPCYNLDREDLQNATSHSDDDVTALRDKILDWHRKQDPPCPLVRMDRATLYLYRQPTQPDTEVVLFENDHHTTPDVRILPQDFRLPDGSTQKDIFLPLQNLVDSFPGLVEGQTQWYAWKRALYLLKEFEKESFHDGT